MVVGNSFACGPFGNSFACGPSYQSQVLLQHRPLATLRSRWGGTIIFVFFWSAFWDLHVLVLKPKSERQPDTWCIFSRGTCHNFQQLEVLGKNCRRKISKTVRLGVQRPSPVVKQHRCQWKLSPTKLSGSSIANSRSDTWLLHDLMTT